MDEIAQVDWLAHHWPFEIRPNWSNGVTRYEVVVGQLNIGAHSDEATAQAWIDGVKLESLAGIVARHRELHPVQVLIEGRTNSVLVGVPFDRFHGDLREWRSPRGLEYRAVVSK